MWRDRLEQTRESQVLHISYTILTQFCSILKSIWVHFLHSFGKCCLEYWYISYTDLGNRKLTFAYTKCLVFWNMLYTFLQYVTQNTVLFITQIWNPSHISITFFKYLLIYSLLNASFGEKINVSFRLENAI